MRIERELCVGCGGCVSGYDGSRRCPTGAIRVENSAAMIDKSLCVRCGQCLELCALGAVVDDDDRGKQVAAT